MIRRPPSPPPAGQPGLRIVLADDPCLDPRGPEAADLDAGEHEVVGEAADGASLLQLLPTATPDVLVLDLGMPGLTGLSYIRGLREGFPQLKILVLTANAEPRTMEGALGAGIAGYLVKGGDLAEFFEALAALQRGETYVSAPLKAVLASDAQTATPAETPPGALFHVPLTRRERELLVLIARGANAREAGALFGISPLTVRKHRENLMRKLDLHSAAELTAFAVRLGLPVG